MASNAVGLKTLCGSLAAVAGTELILRWTALSTDLRPVTVVGFGRLIEAAAIILIVRRWGGGLSRIGLSRESLLPGFIQGVVWSGVFGAAAFLVCWVLYLAGMDPLSLVSVRLPRETAARIAILIVGVLVGPMAEEIFFRGVIFGYFRRWGVIPAVVISTAAFVLLHSAVGITQVVGGLLFASAYATNGRLAAPITIHISGNAALFALSLIFPL